MTKHPIVLVAFFTVSALIAGCSRQRLEPVEPNRPKTVEIAPPESEPNEVAPPTVVSQGARPSTEPNEPETPPGQAREVDSAGPEPNEVQPTEPVAPEEAPPIEPNEVRPDAIEPNATAVVIEPNEVETGVLEPNEVEPNQVRPTPSEPNEAEALPKVTFYNKCAEILSEFVNKDGMVDYSKLRRQRLRLKKLLDEFDELDLNKYKSWPKQDKIALWINAYNMQMLNIIVSNYPIQASRWLTMFYGPYSILHIKGIWTDYKFMVMDEEFTLSAIEQRFFRKEFKDPRVFLALTRASLSSPPLRGEPYCGDKLDQQLNDQCTRFLSSPYGFKIDRDRQAVHLSALFESKPTWYASEFVDKYGTDKKFKDQDETTRAVLNFITNYIARGDVSFLEVENYSVNYMKYDWTLNDSSIRQ